MNRLTKVVINLYQKQPFVLKHCKSVPLRIAVMFILNASYVSMILEVPSFTTVMFISLSHVLRIRLGLHRTNSYFSKLTMDLLYKIVIGVKIY